MLQQQSNQQCIHLVCVCSPSYSKLEVFHPVVCTYNNISLLTVVTQQCGAMFLFCNYQLSDMFRPYRVIIRLHKIMVLDKVHAHAHVPCLIPLFYVA